MDENDAEIEFFSGMGGDQSSETEVDQESYDEEKDTAGARACSQDARMALEQRLKSRMGLAVGDTVVEAGGTGISKAGAGIWRAPDIKAEIQRQLMLHAGTEGGQEWSTEAARRRWYVPTSMRQECSTEAARPKENAFSELKAASSDAAGRGVLRDEAHSLQLSEPLRGRAQSLRQFALESEKPKLPEPLSLFYERADNVWSTEDEVPHTGSSLSLRHPPPHHILVTPPGPELLGPISSVSEVLDDRKSRLSSRQPQGEKKKEKDTSLWYPRDIQGRLVYDSCQHNARRLLSKKEKGQEQESSYHSEPFYKLSGEADTTLVFDSLFESGNLYQAYQSGDRCYDLLLKNDVNTNGHTQWYYFAAANTRKGAPYTFRIINLYKRSSMYNTGLRPLLYSRKLAGQPLGAHGWYRCGADISYRRNEHQYTKQGRGQFYYTLTFSVEFPFDDDTVYLAHCYPYTYTDLQADLCALETDPVIHRRCRRRLLCKTIAGNRCELLTIAGAYDSDCLAGGEAETEEGEARDANGSMRQHTEADEEGGEGEAHDANGSMRQHTEVDEEGGEGEARDANDSMRQHTEADGDEGRGATPLYMSNGNPTPSSNAKRCIVLSARVHPGETNSSWMIKGCINFLVGDSEAARRLRSKYVIKVVPMLNPDGVIVGNYRTGLAGCDLNRKWKQPSKTLQPTIYYMRQMMESMRDKRGIALFVDLHGHSVKNNVFMYGCDANYFENATNHPSRAKPEDLHARLFPALLSNVCEAKADKMFNFQDCRFHVHRRKEASGRVVAWRQFTDNAYTMEASLGGSDAQKEMPATHYSVSDYLEIGARLCVALDQYLCAEECEAQELRAALLKQVRATPLSEADYDSDEETQKRDVSSDDDSDDDTVESIVLPPQALAGRRVLHCGKAKDKEKKENWTSKQAKKAASALAQKKTAAKRPQQQEAPSPVSPTKKEKQQELLGTPRDDHRGRHKQDGASPAKEAPMPKEGSGGGSAGGEGCDCECLPAACQCVSCQVYDEFLSDTKLCEAMQQFLKAPQETLVALVEP